MAAAATAAALTMKISESVLPMRPRTLSVPVDTARWPALILLCLGELMIVLDTTIVNVALPSIRARRAPRR
jgi:hypothetical protein